jgi:hypothetical protein
MGEVLKTLPTHRCICGGALVVGRYLGQLSFSYG